MGSQGAQIILCLLQMACGVFLAASPVPVLLRFGGSAYLVAAALVQIYKIEKEDGRGQPERESLGARNSAENQGLR
jgi:hypothetical protein